MQYSFDSGYLFAIPSAPRDITPIYFGDLKGVTLTVDMKIETEGLQLAVKAIPMASELIISGVARVAMIKSRMLGPLFFNRDLSAGATKMHDLEEAPLTITGGAITVAPVGGTFYQDLGAYFASTGAQLKRVTGAPAAGEYGLTGNVYAFNAADEGKAVQIAYLYTVASGYNFDLKNFWKGPLPLFQMILMNKSDGKQRVVRLPYCCSRQLILPPQVEKYEIQSFTFQCFAEKSTAYDGLVGNFATAE